MNIFPFEASFLEKLIFLQDIKISLNVLFFGFGDDEDIIGTIFLNSEFNTDLTFLHKEVFKGFSVKDDPTKVEGDAGVLHGIIKEYNRGIKKIINSEYILVLFLIIDINHKQW